VGILFNQATRGLSITGKTNKLVAQKLGALLKKKDFDIIVGLFDILSVLSNSKDISFINNEAYTPVDDNSKTDRLSAVFKYVKENYQQDISLTNIAKTGQSYSTLFLQAF
jgi:hypothetical protein